MPSGTDTVHWYILKPGTGFTLEAHKSASLQQVAGYQNEIAPKPTHLRSSSYGAVNKKWTNPCNKEALHLKSMP